jgi:Rrf2 family protein
MQISKKADYALRAVTILGSLPPDKTMQAQEMARGGQIPIKFLEQILLTLKKAGLLRSKRGVGGGYSLAKASRLITIGEVIETVDGELINLIDLNDYPTFSGSGGIEQSLSRIEDSINQTLGETTIEDIINLDSGDSMVGYGI